MISDAILFVSMRKRPWRAILTGKSPQEMAALFFITIRVPLKGARTGRCFCPFRQSEQTIGLVRLWIWPVSSLSYSAAIYDKEDFHEAMHSRVSSLVRQCAHRER